jgi:hypothetical protein
MKSSPAKQTGAKKPSGIMAGQDQAALAVSKSALQRKGSFDDLHARISARAYELYAQRGYREGYAQEDWLEAEQEILQREFPA